MEPSSPPSNVQRLLSAGLEPDQVRDIAQYAVGVYDGNRKPKGAHSGALGSTGWRLYGHLADSVDRFIQYHPYTTDGLATEIVMSRAAVGAAVGRLIEHGFIEKKRSGRGFEFRLLLPGQALIEAYADSCSFEPGMSAYEFERPLLKRALDILEIGHSVAG